MKMRTLIGASVVVGLPRKANESSEEMHITNKRWYLHNNIMMTQVAKGPPWRL